MEIPILDYTDFALGTQTQQEIFCARLLASLSSLGFVKIRNHSIPDEELDEVFAWSKRFFSLPLEHKTKAAHPIQANPHRGWSCVGQEKLSVIAQGKAIFDLKSATPAKESFDQGPPSDPLYPNIWPSQSDIPGFQPFMQTFYERCNTLHLSLLSALALAMHLPASFFVHLCGQNSSELRLNHYPRTTAAELRTGSMMRISSHTDFGTLTLLFQDSVGGLEIEDQHSRGSYIPVTPGLACSASSRNEMVVNVGDCLQRWTNDRLRSANHRVTLPVGAPCDGLVQDRYSVAYFGKPSREVSVRSLPDLLGEGEEVRYKEDITAWEYNQSRLLQTY